MVFIVLERQRSQNADSKYSAASIRLVMSAEFEHRLEELSNDVIKDRKGLATGDIAQKRRY